MFLERTPEYHKVLSFVLKKHQVYLSHSWQICLNVFYKLLEIQHFYVTSCRHLFTLGIFPVPSLITICCKFSWIFFKSRTQWTTDVCLLSNRLLYIGRPLENKMYLCIKRCILSNCWKFLIILQLERKLIQILTLFDHSPSSKPLPSWYKRGKTKKNGYSTYIHVYFYLYVYIFNKEQTKPQKCKRSSQYNWHNLSNKLSPANTLWDVKAEHIGNYRFLWSCLKTNKQKTAEKAHIHMWFEEN